MRARRCSWLAGMPIASYARSMALRLDPLDAFAALVRTRPRITPAPETVRRLRLAFPEVWARYERLAAERAVAGRRRPAARAR
jgi:hypothetical protein